MSAREFPAVEATAFLIAALLEHYEEDVTALASAPMDTAIYARVSRQVDDMRLLCASLPQVSVQWVHLLISHAELMHCLWTRQDEGESPVVARCRTEVLLAVRLLRGRCVHAFRREGSSYGR